jgi:hypothetical protein
VFGLRDARAAVTVSSESQAASVQSPGVPNN